jgi:LysM domain
LNRFAILSALGGAVIAVALLVNYAINREGVGEGSAPTPTVTTAPSTAGTPAPSGGTSSGQAGTSAPSTEAPAAQSSTSESGSTSSPSNAGAAQEQAATSGATGGAPASEAVGQSAAPALPAAPRSASGAVSSAAGTSSTVASTGNAGGGAATTPAIKPSFDIVRVNPDGGTVIAGRAAPHADVTLTADGQKLGTVTADDRGEWVIVPESKLAPGNHQIAIASQLGDSAPVPSDDIVVVVVPRPQVASGGQSSGGTQTALAQPQQPLAVVVPRTDQGSTVLQAPSPPQSGLLALQSVDYDADGLVVIGGQAPPGKQVRAYLDNRLIGIARADSSGRWRVKPSGMVPPGLHTLRVDEVDDSGKVLARVESPFSRAEPLNIAAGDQVVVVQPGNSLWLIATRTYGSGFRYTVIYQANKTQIKDPDLIYPGQVFKLPTASASP